jgi:RNA recognition motif. (a.k.a. RRM, RBD, or RNP domain)
MEIFTTFGTIKFCEFGTDRLNNNKGYCFIEFNSSEDAENAMKNMDGGQIDGQEITCAPVLAAPRPPRRIPRRSPMMRRSPPRWGGGGGRGRFVKKFHHLEQCFVKEKYCAYSKLKIVISTMIYVKNDDYLMSCYVI